VLLVAALDLVRLALCVQPSRPAASPPITREEEGEIEEK
jgi:hypothetical protein